MTETPAETETKKRTRKSAFTLIELVIVVAIIALLISVLVKVGGSAITRSKISQTRAVMQVIQTAIDQYKSEAPLAKIVYDGRRLYQDRYGNYPPDELEGFTSAGTSWGLPHDSGPQTVSIAPGYRQGAVNPNISIGGSALNSAGPPIQHADIKAMVLAITLYSPTASSILDQLGGQYRRVEKTRDEFLDRDGSMTATAATDDQMLTYYVDVWGTPFDYFALRDNNPPTVDPLVPAPSDTIAGDRLRTSTALVTRNRGQAVLLSYGPDGPDQFSPDFQVGGRPQDIVFDYVASDPTPGTINNLLNDDTIFLDETLNERLRREPE
jgi:prepilin-type N-terminal cleavage/methylation domain-containing protein